MSFLKNRRGFTLIELLVVMTIISILAGLSFIGFLGTRASTRDTKRRADMEQIRSALEAYRSDYGGYPATANFSPAGGLSCNPGSGLVSYLGATTDPLPADLYKYIGGAVTANGCTGSGTGVSTYALCARLEVAPSPALVGGQPCFNVSCGSGGVCNYEVDNP